MDTNFEARLLALLDDALEVPPADRDAWLDDQCGGDDALKTRLTGLLRSSDASWIRTGAAARLDADEALPERIGAYRITGLIGQGGMGAVYRGERAAGDFDHVAAIKLIRPGALSEELVGRFRRERQTLARLSHPNIARLFDGGETEEGQPYLVMEYVEGRPLGSWLVEASPSRTDRLAIFLKICAAVASAHQNLVIHRDLTPANVLVDTAGEPKLIDFGIARPVDAAGDAMTQTATPGFAAPERRAGAPATTLADIYALGVLLDMLLGEGADRDLKAIIARASANDPADRYSSVDALADDLERYRDGRAVAARDGGAAYRMGRFITRYRLPVAAATLAVLVLIGALVATLIANHRAEMARAEAEKRFEQTRAIAKTMIFDAYDEVSRVPGSTRARETLARAGLGYLRALAADPDAPFALRVEAGEGYARLANVIGSGQTATLGKLADGGKLLDQAEAILERAHRERPAEAAPRRALAGLLADRAQVSLYDGNDVAKSRAAAQRAAQLLEPDKTRDAWAAGTYIKAVAADADTHIWENDWKAASPIHDRAENFATSLPGPLRDTRQVRLARAANLRLKGETLHKLKDKDGARAALDQSVDIYENLLAGDPSDPELTRAVIVANRYRAVVHRSNYRDALAQQSIDRAAALATRMRDADPNDAAIARTWLVVSELQSQILADAKRYDEAFVIHDRLVEGYRRLITLSGDAAGIRRNFSSALRIIGGNYYNGGAYARACEAWRQSTDLIGWLEANGELTGADKKRREGLEGYRAKACDPPRPGLGPETE